jgi:hypothetical protein
MQHALKEDTNGDGAIRSAREHPRSHQRANESADATARFHAGNEPHLASGLLQHRHNDVTENYNLASSFEAAQRSGIS